MVHLKISPHRKGDPFFGNYWLVVSNIFYFYPYLGTWSNLTNIFQTGWNHQLDYHFEVLSQTLEVQHINADSTLTFLFFSYSPRRVRETRPGAVETWEQVGCAVLHDDCGQVLGQQRLEGMIHGFVQTGVWCYSIIHIQDVYIDMYLKLIIVTWFYTIFFWIAFVFVMFHAFVFLWMQALAMEGDTFQ